MSSNPHEVTRRFEEALCKYTGAPFAVAVNSCTMALLLAVRWRISEQRFRGAEADWRDGPLVEIPKRTYVGVPMSILHAGARVAFRDQDWLGMYELRPLNVWDSARWLFGGMYEAQDYESDVIMCLSFHASKTLGDSQGGAILHADPKADAWFRRARFDGRAEGVHPSEDTFDTRGWHCYLSPDVSARLLWKLGSLPKDNEPLPNDNYPDLSLHKAFR